MSEWEKLTEETEVSYLWFSRYRDYGGERSLVKVCQKYDKKDNYRVQLGKWSKQHRWPERVAAYDAYLDEQKRTTLENERLQMAREHIAVADKTMEAYLRMLNALDLEKVNAGAIKGFGEFAVKTKRDALGVVEEHKISGDINVTDKNAERIAAEIRELTRKALAVRDGDDDAAE